MRPPSHRISFRPRFKSDNCHLLSASEKRILEHLKYRCHRKTAPKLVRICCAYRLEKMASTLLEGLLVHHLNVVAMGNSGSCVVTERQLRNAPNVPATFLDERDGGIAHSTDRNIVVPLVEAGWFVTTAVMDVANCG